MDRPLLKKEHHFPQQWPEIEGEFTLFLLVNSPSSVTVYFEFYRQIGSYFINFPLRNSFFPGFSILDVMSCHVCWFPHLFLGTTASLDMVSRLCPLCAEGTGWALEKPRDEGDDTPLTSHRSSMIIPSPYYEKQPHGPWI